MINFPSPHFDYILPDTKGKNAWERFCIVCTVPPRFKIVHDWVVELSDGTIIIIPKGFITDGASIPRVFWSIISPTGPLFLASILHDFAYQHGYLLTLDIDRMFEDGRNILFYKTHIKNFKNYAPIYVLQSQRFFDAMLRDVTIDLTDVKFQSNAAYYALGLAGFIAWNRYRKKGPSAYNSNSLGLPGVKGV